MKSSTYTHAHTSHTHTQIRGGGGVGFGDSRLSPTDATCGFNYCNDWWWPTFPPSSICRKYKPRRQGEWKVSRKIHPLTIFRFIIFTASKDTVNLTGFHHKTPSSERKKQKKPHQSMHIIIVVIKSCARCAARSLQCPWPTCWCAADVFDCFWCTRAQRQTHTLSLSPWAACSLSHCVLSELPFLWPRHIFPWYTATFISFPVALLCKKKKHVHCIFCVILKSLERLLKRQIHVRASASPGSCWINKNVKMKV